MNRSGLPIRPKADARYDIVSLGEVMLRLDPGESRIRNARTFRVWEGGGEYNVARGLRRCFGQRAAVVTSIADNEVGRLVEDLILQGGVDPSFIQWRDYDGSGGRVRNGLNFTERGFGVRGALGVSDRGHTAASQLRPGDVNWEHLFGTLGVRWFHTGGIYAALSETAPLVVEEAMGAARRHGTVVSYDLNYRPSLWKDIGGHAKAQEINSRLASLVDVMIGNEEHFTACLGFGIPNTDASLTDIEADNFVAMLADVTTTYPNFRAVGMTLRGVRTATVNDWSALAWVNGEIHRSTARPGLEIFDRVGGGDSFASGLIYGLMELDDPALAVEYGAAHGALTMTTPGDNSVVSLKEVEALVAGAGARVQR